MTAINSNRAIRGPVTAVPVVAGKVVRLVADTENNRWVVEADETVLFYTDNPSSVTTITLSESTMNFEWIEVDAVSITASSSNLGFFNAKFSPATVHSNGGYWWARIYFDGSDGNSESFVIHTCDSKWRNVDTANWTRVYQRLDNMSDQTNNGWFRIRKITGIHRIASN